MVGDFLTGYPLSQYGIGVAEVDESMINRVIKSFKEVDMDFDDELENRPRINEAKSNG